MEPLMSALKYFRHEFEQKVNNSKPQQNKVGCNMAVIHIDGKTYDVDGSDNLLSACLSLGIDVPYFCYHPALGSVGSCRQCARQTV